MPADPEVIVLTDDGQARLLDYELAELAAADRARFELVMLAATDAFLALATLDRGPSLWEIVAATIANQDGRGPSVTRKE